MHDILCNYGLRPRDRLLKEPKPKRDCAGCDYFIRSEIDSEYPTVKIIFCRADDCVKQIK